MVVFTTNDLVPTIRQLRPSTLPILIVPRALESFKVASMLDTEGWTKQEQLDHEFGAGHSRKLYWIWNEKTWMVREVVIQNPFSSDYFAWLDIGAIRHENFNGKLMMQKLPEEPGLLLLQIAPFTPAELQFVDGISSASFQYVNRIGGGMFGGDSKHIKQWSEKFYQVFYRYLTQNRFVGKDQSVMATTCIELDICLLLDYNGDWFYLQDYYMNHTSGVPTRLNFSKPIVHTGFWNLLHFQKNV